MAASFLVNAFNLYRSVRIFTFMGFCVTDQSVRIFKSQALVIVSVCGDLGGSTIATLPCIVVKARASVATVL